MRTLSGAGALMLVSRGDTLTTRLLSSSGQQVGHPCRRSPASRRRVSTRPLQACTTQTVISSSSRLGLARDWRRHCVLRRRAIRRQHSVGSCRLRSEPSGVDRWLSRHHRQAQVNALTLGLKSVRQEKGRLGRLARFLGSPNCHQAVRSSSTMAHPTNPIRSRSPQGRLPCCLSVGPGVRGHP
jgi:hypothetical protein